MAIQSSAHSRRALDGRRHKEAKEQKKRAKRYYDQLNYYNADPVIVIEPAASDEGAELHSR